MVDGSRSADDELLDSVGAAFARLRRRTHLVKTREQQFDRKDLSRNLIINVIDEAAGEMTVGGIAEQLGFDASVASRIVSDMISNGYLERAASQHDGRRTVLRLTEEGVVLRDRYRSQHRQAFEHITKDWPTGERLEFARLLLKYADATSALSRDDAS
ncbi:MarR family winged helix-turn-helix transcriptional regulator [Streptosporangium sp. NPDC002721]|uniref:MarR family winged helix-turn-helix transcriptional regulator n=1 Tax=Streptosporangium sp. NPDC002721 TaxID=3366188 RepID=UPI003693E436